MKRTTKGRRGWQSGCASGFALTAVCCARVAHGATFLETGKLLPSNIPPGGSAAGVSVAVNAGAALIGGDAADAAWLFRQGPAGWTSDETLTPQPADDPGGFAFSVALQGPWAIVGAAEAINDAGIATGAVDIFRRDTGVWSFVTRLWADDGLAGDRFGSGVAIDGSTIVIGADAVDAVKQDAGAAYVFQWSGDTWSQTAKLWAADGNLSARFGKTVAISGTTLVAGAPRDDDGGLNAGAAYVFENVEGVWQPTIKLKAQDGAPEDRFATSVDIDGDAIIAGAFRDGPKGANSGSAYIFERNGDPWSQVKKLIASDGQTQHNFGISVAIAEGIAAVGSFADQATGRVYLFERLNSQWTETEKVNAGDGQPMDHFGAAVALDGLTLIVGATGDDDRGADAGAAYIFQRGVRGDLDGNGVLDAFDVDDFELALADRQAYLTLRPGLDPDVLGDIDADGDLDAFDVDDFEALLAGAPVPEPGPLLLMAAGSLGALRRRHRGKFLTGG